MTDREEWRPVVGFEGLYSVSSLGRVRSESRSVHHYRGGSSTLKERILSPEVDGRGYHRFILCKSGKKFHRSAHRLVCEAFYGPPTSEKPFALHGDGNPKNNRITNLRWGSASDNMSDKTAHGNNHELNKTHCPSGHEYSGDNLYLVPKTGKRQCRACAKRRKGEVYAKDVVF